MSDARIFLEDLTAEGLLHAVLLRSPVSRGRLLGIDLPQIPASCTLIRAIDIPGENRLEACGADMCILASDEISYRGEPLAILVGPDPAVLERLAQSAHIRVKEEKPRYAFEKFSSDQLAAKRMACVGKPEEAFAKAAHVVEGTYRTGAQEHWYAECHGALARFSYDKLLVSVASQWPFHVRTTVAAVLDVENEDIVVEPCEIGLNLDGKLWFPSLVAAQASLAAVLCKRPVKLLFAREEDVLFSPKRPSVVIRERAALSSQGELLALETRAVVDIGATGPFAEETLDRICLGSLGAYRCPNIRVEGYAVKTNTLPTGPFAGFGLSQAFFAVERHIGKIAQSVNMDPVEWRELHALHRGDPLATGAILKDDVPAVALIDSSVKMSDYRRKWAAYELVHHSKGDEHPNRDEKLRGIGLAFAYQGNGFLASDDNAVSYSVETTLGKDGSLEIRTSAVSGSRETAVLWRAIAAEILNIDADDVRLAPNRSDTVPDSGPSSLSRNVTIVTRLIERCCHAIRKQRFRDPLPITIKRSYRAPKTGGWNGSRMEGNPFSQFSWASAVVEVEIDPVDYTTQVRGVWLSIDGGKILNERRARTSLMTSSRHALGWASREVLAMKDGSYQSPAVLSYNLAMPSDSPPITIDFTWTDSVVPKGIGELPFTCIPAAYAQALSQATGTSFDNLPITPVAIRDALEGR